jgi:hypothetical protein
MAPELEGEDDGELDLRAQLDAAFEGDDQSTDDQAPVTEPQLDENGNEQPRDEQGRWTRAQQEHYEEQQRQQQEQQQTQEQELRLAPPPGWAPAAKAAYASLPPEVQTAVAQREAEINNGFRKLQEYKGLDEYAEMARESGTTLREALDRYKAAEDNLDRDFAGGIAQLCQMYQVHPVQLAQTFLRAFGGQQPQGMPQGAPQGDLIARRLAGMEETVRTLISERERGEQEAINQSLEAFASENMYFEDVRQDMALLIREGRANSLEQAYSMACRMHPEIGDLLIKEQAAPQIARQRVDQARRASSGLRTGAPAGSPSGNSSSNSLRDALADAWNDAQGI